MIVVQSDHFHCSVGQSVKEVIGRERQAHVGQVQQVKRVAEKAKETGSESRRRNGVPSQRETGQAGEVPKGVSSDVSDVVAVQAEGQQLDAGQVDEGVAADGLQVGVPDPEVTRVGGDAGDDAQAVTRPVAFHVVVLEADAVPSVAAVVGNT